MGIFEYIVIGIGVLIVILLVVLLGKVSALRKGLASEVSHEVEEALENDLANQRSELNQRLDGLYHNINLNINARLSQFEQTMTSNNAALDGRMEAMRLATEQQLRENRETTQTKLDEMREANQQKLSEIQGTVAEKLDKTLAERVNESFKSVSQQLEQVYKGLGEMQTLASDVGSLKNALVNVKVRGEIGEVQLSRILEQMLTAEQYDENVITKKGSRDPVEFAIKIPSKNSDSKFIYLPVDAKFPLDRYNALVEAYEEGSREKADAARKALKERILTDAKNIYTKYISVPDTTDFAIMFLPTEGLFSEVIRDVELTEKLRVDFKVTVCGPSTITAFLNSLQMGFRTLTVEKKSNQIALTLSAVKTEFGKFGESLTKVQRTLESTGKELDQLVGTRTRAINRKLKDIDTISEIETSNLLSDEDE
ncbi:MAG: DNA recombination protein RmuC [Lachnospiraceae bacterium]|nr:DNA recombination protein RmuC [Lachnospiraceae bacterium]